MAFVKKEVVLVYHREFVLIQCMIYNKHVIEGCGSSKLYLASYL